MPRRAILCREPKLDAHGATLVAAHMHQAKGQTIDCANHSPSGGAEHQLGSSGELAELVLGAPSLRRAQLRALASGSVDGIMLVGWANGEIRFCEYSLSQAGHGV